MKLYCVVVFAIILSACSGRASTFRCVGSSPDTLCSTKNVWEQTCNPWLLTSPRVHLIFWGNWWLTATAGNSQALALSQEWQTLANDPNFYLPMSQYGIGAGQLDGIFYADPSLPSGGIEYDDVQQELLNEIGNDELPAMDNQSVYVLLLPPATQAQYDISNHYGGYHGFITNGNNTSSTYAVIENDNNDGMSYTISHEVAESSTNPNISSGWWAGAGESEIADDCEGSSYVLDGYTITQLWNQLQCQCGPL
jgi:hypothetical protein